MLDMSIAIERRDGSASSVLPSIVGSDLRPASHDERARYAADRALDQVLADSFPASDPPPWTLGVPGPAPGHHTPSADRRDAEGGSRDHRGVGRTVVLDVSLHRDPAWPLLRALTSIAGAAGIALLVPFVILLVGLPIALVVRGVAEVCGWLLARLAG